MKNYRLEFIRKSNLVHSEIYDYSKVEYKNNKKSVTIICKKHGEFKQRPDCHLRGFGCSDCSGNKRLDTELFILKSRQIFIDRYDYSKAEYKNNKTKVILVCKNHGDFLTTPYQHLNGAGCQKCSKRKRFLDDFINDSNIIHHFKYDYSKVEYINVRSKVKIICPNHGIFEQKVYEHLMGHGCNRCLRKSENKWLDSLGITIRQFPIRIGGYKFLVDGYDDLNQTVYEFDGDFWHGNPEIYNQDSINKVNGKSFGHLYQKTLEKRRVLEIFGYKVIRIWESEFLKNKEIDSD